MMQTPYTKNLTLEEMEANPYDVYRRLRAESPVVYIPAVNSWLVTKWDDVQKIGTSPDLFQATDEEAPVSIHFGKTAIIHTDGDLHRELRGGLAPHYAPRKVAEYIEDLVVPLAEECIAAFPEDGNVNLVDDYFEPISVQCLARTLGVNGIDTKTLQEWFHGLVMGAINYSRDPERTRICEETKKKIDKALDPIFAELEKAPNNTPLSHLMYHGMPEGERRSREFIMPTVLVMLLGGAQEPGHGAASTMAALLENPDQLDLVRSDMATNLPKAVAEGIRWVAPIGTQVRKTTQDVELNGVTIPEGQTVCAVLASANRDEDVFDDADRFDIERDAKNHAAFGFGPHFCAGKWMASPQMEIAIRVLLEKFSSITLDTEKPHDFFGWEFRAPTSLWVHAKP
ncbi:cytochrome P450 [Profundibacter sp.]|uniref:cytochrome P450 n=1 Tax=Profundibacter sp. TaxID=3101071 RepID=UPI003D0F01E4